MSKSKTIGLEDAQTSFNKYGVCVGIDEAGRGCLAGPVVAAAVILPQNFKSELLNDSKKVSKANRNLLAEKIKSEAVEYAIAFVDEQTIDKINILQATYLAMHNCIEQIKTTVDILLIDGNRFKPYKDYRHECIVKGDGKIMCIAAASILAKTARDEYMQNLAIKHPQYYFHKNMGYGTAQHVAAIKSFGYSSAHRKTFRLKPQQLKLF